MQRSAVFSCYPDQAPLIMPEICTTIYDRFVRSAALWPERPTLNVLSETADIYEIDAGETRYRDALVQIDIIADQFTSAGFLSGERVLLLLENRPLFFMYWLALNRLGISVVPVNPDLRLAELAYLIGHAEPSLAITLPSHLQLLQSAATAAASNMSIIESGADFPDNHHAHPVARSGTEPAEREAAVLYTSGTTGHPKGCVLSNTYFLMSGDWYASTGGLCNLDTNGERMITPLPVFHMNAMAYSFMAMVTVGGCLTCLDRFHPRSWWHNVRSSGATCLHYLGVMPTLLMGAQEDLEDQNHQVRFGFGAGIDPGLHQAFELRFGFPLVEAWAMTETGAGAVIAANREPRQAGKSSIGSPESNLQFRLVDESGQVVEPGTPGELLVRHAGDNPRKGFFTEYYKDQRATDEAWLDGWFHTGDLVRVNNSDDSGTENMVFVDRKKNVIRRSGENIAAIEVESVLMQHPDITAAGVAAVPDAIRGDEVFACLQINTKASPELAHAIARWCLEKLAYFKAPAYIAFVDALPLTATQKIQRGELKRLAVSLVQDPATVNTAGLKKRQNL